MSLEAAIAAVVASPDLRVLRRLPFPPHVRDVLAPERLVGVIVDVETTGLDQDIDEVIELAMIKFEFDREGRLGGEFSTLQAFNEPTTPIPDSIARLTGIDDERVRGHRIDPAALDAFVSGATLVVAHNAAFDRPFLEGLSSNFGGLPWACTATEIDWQSEGIAGSRLEYIAMAFGTFYDAHRALDDCNAVANLLSFDLPRSGERALSSLLSAARRVQIRVFAVGAPYELRVPLKRAGYRWNDGTNGYPRAWWKDVEPDLVDFEARFLKDFGPDAASPTLYRMTARTRFRRSVPSGP